MNTDEMPDLAPSESTRFLLKEETHRTSLRVGLIVNFKHPKLEFERVVR